MTSFPLKIVTPDDGIQFDGEAEELLVRTICGDVVIMAKHINYVAPLGMGEAVVQIDGVKRYAACIGGMVSVTDGHVMLVPTTFEWAEQIDVDRAEAADHRAHEILDDVESKELDIRLAQAMLKRALIRKNVAAHKPK